MVDLGSIRSCWCGQKKIRASTFAFSAEETFTQWPAHAGAVFGGYGFGDDIFSKADMTTKAYARGVLMGGDLASRGEQSPEFLVWVTRDPRAMRYNVRKL